MWSGRPSGREGGEQLAVGGKTSVEDKRELPSKPPVRSSRLVSLAGPENNISNDWSLFAMLFKFDQKIQMKMLLKFF